MAKALPSSQMEIPKPAAEDWSWLATENGFDRQEEPPEFVSLPPPSFPSFLDARV